MNQSNSQEIKMLIKQSLDTARIMKLAIAGVASFAMQAVVAQDLFFIEHKPTGNKMMVCDGELGKPVSSRPHSNLGECVQWERIQNGDFFHLRSVHADKFIKPDTNENGSPISIQPTAWTGNWTQWSYDDRGDGFGHIVNRATGKLIFLSGKNRANVAQQPASWRGDFTRWAFVSVEGNQTPPATPSSTPAPTCSPLPPVVSTFEAESGQILGAAQLFDDGAASGGQGIAFINTQDSGFSLATNLSSDLDRTITSISVRYTSELSGNISYRINGTDSGNISFASTGAWVGAYQDAEVSVTEETITSFDIFFDAGDAAMNVDSVTITAESDCSVTITPSPTPTVTSTPDGSTPTPSPTPQAGDDVEISSNAQFGNFLAGGPGSSQPGFTLYTFANDNGGPNSSCNGQCAVVWPPLLVESANDLSGPNSLNLGTSTRTDGTIQVTYNNEPLYFYNQDNAPGDTNGHNAGGVWFVAVVDSGSTPTPAPTPSSTPVIITPPPTPTPAPTPGGPGADGDFCLTLNGDVTHVDLPFRANYSFLCLNGSCQPASLNDGVWVRSFGAVNASQTYEIKTQIDHSTGECGITHNVQPGQCVASTCLPPDEEAPTVPTNLQGEGRNGRAALLSWNASTDNRAVAKYEIFRDGSKVGESRTTSYSDSGLNEQTTYSYAVSACDSAPNCSAQTSSISINTGVFVPDTTPPTVPGRPTGEALSETEISVNWAASTDAEGVVDLYELRRNGSVIASFNGTSYEDSGLSTATSYNYDVRARDDSGNWSGFSQVGAIETDRPDFSYLDFTTASHPGKRIGPAPRSDRPDALATPVNGAQPTRLGFAFDISGNQLTWRWGPEMFTPNDGNVQQVRTVGDSDLEMHCSEDDNKTFKVAKLSNSTLTIPCEGVYTYWFRYKHPLPLSSLAGTEWIHTGLFTTARRIDVNNYTPFTDGSSNWMRWRHPVAHDGCTAAVSNACHNNGFLNKLDRYNIWFDDSPGNVSLGHNVDGGILRAEAMRWHGGNSNGQQQFVFNQGTGFGNAFSYGQVIQFELTALAGSQVYNDFSYYTVGLGWGNYGDPRLNMAGRAGTTMIIAGAPGSDIYNEQEAIFTQPLVTVHDEGMMNDFIVGHHLFHGIDPTIERPENAPHDSVKIGTRTCGDCHFRDGRGSEVIQTPRGPRLPPPVYGTTLLEWMEGREAGFRWDGGVATVKEQIHNAFREDHGVNPNHLPPEVLNAIETYTEVLTVPSRRPAVYDDPAVARGDVVFNEIGCANCHQPVARTRSDAPSHLRDITIRPYTDMKIWDLGEGRYRTPALWGLSHNLTLLTSRGRAVRYMHDGGSSSIDAAIGRHGGSGTSSRANYNALSGSDKTAVVKFIESL